jgi:hypothetical protein
MQLDGAPWMFAGSSAMSIWDAAKAGDLAEVQRLVGHDPRLLNGNRGLLRCASQHGHLKVVRWLLIQGSAVNERNDEGWTALLYASCCGHTPVVRLLLERGGTLPSPTSIVLLPCGGHLNVDMRRPCGASWTTPAPPPPPTTGTRGARRHFLGRV